MSNLTKRFISVFLIIIVAVSIFAGCKKDDPSSSTPKSSTLPASSAPESTPVAVEDPIKISVFYSDNATLPFREDWLTVKTAEEWFNVDLEFEPIPIADYQTKVSLALNTGTNAPDVILYQSITGENVSLATNGALVAISDYTDHLPNFTRLVDQFGLKDELALKYLSDGKLYYMPALYDQAFYDGGLIMREDLLEEYNLPVPTTFDEFYDVLKVFKENNPDSYPLTILAGPRVLYRMTMPSFGISLGKNGASGTQVLSWDYDKQEYFAGATDDRFKEYVTYLHKLYAEGLLDPEMADPIDGDSWSTKLATGKSFATYAYYDQIGGVQGTTEIDGFKLNMFPPLAGPGGAHHQEKGRLSSGVLFPAATAKREDFTRVLETVDNIFFSDEGAKLWGLGVEGVTYTEAGGKVTFSDEVLNSPDGIYKHMQVAYGSGTAVTQMVWRLEQEMLKYDENYASINTAVAAMPNAILPIPPTPLFDDLISEEASSLQTPLGDAFEVWIDEFITGKKDIEADWATYVSEMEGLQIVELTELYNSNSR